MRPVAPPKARPAAVFRSDAREAEGAPLLREYRVKSSIEGSNPSHSATSEIAARGRRFFFPAQAANGKEPARDAAKKFVESIDGFPHVSHNFASARP